MVSKRKKCILKQAHYINLMLLNVKLETFAEFTHLRITFAKGCLHCTVLALGFCILIFAYQYGAKQDS